MLTFKTPAGSLFWAAASAMAAWSASRLPSIVQELLARFRKREFSC
jgi:hypothetical protein